MNILESLQRKIPNRIKLPLQRVLCLYQRLYKKMMLFSPEKYFKMANLKKVKTLRLNIGCGKIRYPGWVNIDCEPDADLVIDIRKALPFDSNSVDFIYCEHLLEHFTYEEGEKVLIEFQKCLKRRSIIRIAMPDLNYIIQKYNTDWKSQEWLSWSDYATIKTKGQMINAAFRSWEHKYLYNEEDLRNQLIKAGFSEIASCKWNESSHSDLRNLETRKDSKLIMEAKKNANCY